MNRETVEKLLTLAMPETLVNGGVRAWIGTELVPALEAELETLRTPLADLQLVRQALLAEMHRTTGKDLLDTVAQLRQVLGQVDRMEQQSGVKAGTGAGKLDALKAGNGTGLDDWD